MTDFNQITDLVFQGGALDTVPPGVQAILDLQMEHEDIVAPNVIHAFCWMPINDSPSEAPTIEWLDMAVEFCKRAMKMGWPVYIHCAAGISRSGMVDVAVQMKTKGLTRDQALSLVRTKRPQTNPNGGFMESLAKYEKFLHEDTCPCQTKTL